jgi:hypothetical protein
MRGADSAGIINPDPILPGAPKPIGVEVSMEKKGAETQEIVFAVDGPLLWSGLSAFEVVKTRRLP